MKLDDLKPEDVDNMSVEEVLLWHSKARQEQELERAIKELKDFLDVRNNTEVPNTIKLETE